ncbi:MAG: hypothetical protein HRU06_16140 [Oceanospirillaceae bacterium]|nr:hypothetical protein [Oceanospirillaceae bacterium]
MNKTKSNKFYIITLILITALMLMMAINWKQPINFALKSQEYNSTKNSDAPYKINVYYFPSKKRAATALTYYFTQQGYLIEMLPAAELDGLNVFRYSSNRIFFNHDDFATAMEIKEVTQRILGYPLNAYRFKVTQATHSMMIVFTEG